MKNLAEQSDAGSEKNEETDVESNSSYSRSDENLNSILSYLEDDEGSNTIFAQGRNKADHIPDKYRNSKSVKRVRSLFAFSNTCSSARIYNSGFTNVSSEISDLPDTNKRSENSNRESEGMCLIFNSNPVFSNRTPAL